MLLLKVSFSPLKPIEFLIVLQDAEFITHVFDKTRTDSYRWTTIQQGLEVFRRRTLNTLHYTIMKMIKKTMCH